MKKLDHSKVLLSMIDVARKVGDMLLKEQSKALSLPTRKDFVTDADLKSEKMILAALKKLYPGIPALAEESGGKIIMEGYLWVIDPIDGTVNYYNQDDHWGVSIGLVYNGKSVAGVVYLPGKKLLFYAADAVPTYMFHIEVGTMRVQVSNQSNLAESQFWMDWLQEQHGGADHARVPVLLGTLDKGGFSLYPQIRLCATASLMAVAQGKIAGYLHLRPSPFDIAAAGLIVENAGGTVTDLAGNPWAPFGEGMLATNGANHQKIVELVHGV